MFIPTNKKLLDAVTTTGVSGWETVWPYEDITLHFYGLVAGDIVKVEASNEDGTPTNGVQFGTDITEDDIAILNELPRRIRVNFSDRSGGGTVTVIMQGRRPSR